MIRRTGSQPRGCIQPWVSSATPRWMSSRRSRSFIVTWPGVPSPWTHSPPSDLTVPTGVMTAAVPQAKTSVRVPFAVSSRHWSMETRPSSDS